MCVFAFIFQSADYGTSGTNIARKIGSNRSPRGPILHIAKVRKEDSGTYICTASNGVGTMSADQIELNVLCEYCNIASTSIILYQPAFCAMKIHTFSILTNYTIVS